MGPTTLIILMLGYFLVLMCVSWMQKSKSAGNRAFFQGDGHSPWFVVSVGMVGASISGVSFVSVPGMVLNNDMLYMQTVLGFFVGYILIAEILLPIYYSLDSPSIYTYLLNRFGNRSYKTGSAFFLLSKITGAAVRLYVVVLILQYFILDSLGIPFAVTTAVILLMVWLYSRQGGIKTIVWTDLFQTLILLSAMVLLIIQVCHAMDVSAMEACGIICKDEHFRWFEWSDWHSQQHFVKQFTSGIFIALVMTGLDQDMMQKNLTIRNIKDARRNIYIYGFSFVPVNFLFMCLGILLLVFADREGIALPASTDDILPMFATRGYLGNASCILFVIGIVAASFSSVDSALTALTTSFCMDILGRKDDTRARRLTHVGMTIVIFVLVVILNSNKNNSLLDIIYVIAGYTYGPLLGLFAFGLFTKRNARDCLTPMIAVVSPLICGALQLFSTRILGYSFGYEILMVNGMLTFSALWLSSARQNSKQHLS